MTIDEAVQAAKDQVGEIEKLRPVYQDVQAVLGELGWSARPDASPGYRYIGVHASVKEIGQLADFSRAVAKRGYRITGRSEQPENGTQVIDYGDHQIVLFASFYGGRCSYVQVGEKTVPVMELRCENGDDAGEEKAE